MTKHDLGGDWRDKDLRVGIMTVSRHFVFTTTGSEWGRVEVFEIQVLGTCGMPQKVSSPILEGGQAGFVLASPCCACMELPDRDKGWNQHLAAHRGLHMGPNNLGYATLHFSRPFLQFCKRTRRISTTFIMAVSHFVFNPCGALHCDSRPTGRMSPFCHSLPLSSLL